MNRKFIVVLITALLLLLGTNAIAVEKVIVDSDLNFLTDDLMALLMLLQADNIEVLGVTSVLPSPSHEQGIANALRVIETAGKPDVGVYPGSKVSLMWKGNVPKPVDPVEPVGGFSTLKPQEKHAVDFIIDTINEDPGNVNIVALGPLTNIALALQKDPTIAEKVKHMYIMGGQYGISNGKNQPWKEGEAATLAEYNIWADAEAAYVVFHSGIPMTIDPLEVGRWAILKQEHLDRITAVDTPVAQLFHHPGRFFTSKASPDDPNSGWDYTYDEIAALSIIRPDLVKTKEVPIDVITSGPTYGQTFVYGRNAPEDAPRVNLIYDVDYEAFIDVFVELMTKDEMKKVILDTDMVFGFDDGICMVMLANAPNIDLLGVVTNYAHNYVTIEAAAGIRQLELIGKADEIPVFMGCPYPIYSYRVKNADYAAFETTFLGRNALKGEEPESYEAYIASNPLPERSFGVTRCGMPVTPVQEEHGVTWMIETIRANPNEVTIVAIGSMTNIAAAILLDPGIVPLVKEICYMSSSWDIPGNTTPAAEYNIWYDPEAAKAVYRAPWNKQVFNSLDIDQYYKYRKETHDQIKLANTPITRMLDEIYGERFEQDPEREVNIWDLLSAAYVIDPTLFPEIQERWVDVDTNFGLNYGRTVSWTREGRQAPGAQKADILWKMDEERFWDLFVELVTMVPEDPVNPVW